MDRQQKQVAVTLKQNTQRSHVTSKTFELTFILPGKISWWEQKETDRMAVYLAVAFSIGSVMTNIFHMTSEGQSEQVGDWLIDWLMIDHPAETFTGIWKIWLLNVVIKK